MMNDQRGIGDGVDLDNYSWVDQYLKGLKYQEAIKALKEEIEGVQRFPRAKPEILEALKGIGGQVKARRVAQVGSILAAWQNGEIQSLTPETFALVWVVPEGAGLSRSHTAAHDFDSLLAPGIIEAALKELPKGMTAAEKAAKITELKAKIEALEAKLEQECWPESRKVFDDKAQRDPHADRWQEVVESWGKVAAPYNKPVDLYGRIIEQTDPAWEAFRKLGFRLSGDTAPRPQRR
jgi:hypothetical protein